MLIEQIIEKKKQGAHLSTDEIQAFVSGIVDTSVSNEQIAAFAMAVNFQDMEVDETSALTLAMRDSGEYLKREDFQDYSAVVDKHSTGGIGDSSSLILAPLLAAYGFAVPMIAGRGLGHTGGTIDKLESIPGYQAQISSQQFKHIVQQHGMAIVGQSEYLAPADRRFYAVRDTTATIDILPLIVASILSKKLSEGLDGLVMDIKVGNGAFMQTLEQATNLGVKIKNTAEASGVKTAIQYNDMNQPLCPVAGNALEVAYVMDHLQGKIKKSRLLDNALDLCIELIQLFEDQSEESIRAELSRLLDSGEALLKFQSFLSALGVTEEFADNYETLLPKSPYVHAVNSSKSGIITHIDTKSIGNFLIRLNAGRQVATDALDYAAGLSQIPELNSSIQSGEVLGVLHHSNPNLNNPAIHADYINCFTIE